MKKITIIIFALVVLASSCTSLAPTPTPHTALPESECLPPLFAVSYPVITPESSRNPTGIPLQGNWEIQENLPYDIRPAEIILRPQQNELWFASLMGLYRYSIENGTWKSYQTNDLANFRHPEWTNIERLFVSSDGTIWGSITDASLLGEDNHPLLVRFNDSTDRFEFVPDKDGLLGVQEAHRINANIVEDQSGRLWFFASNPDFTEGTLYSFDPKTYEAQTHDEAQKNRIGSYFAAGPDGDIWYLTSSGVDRYNPATGDTSFYNYPYQDNWGAHKLYFDRSGNLWLDGNGWLDLSNDDAHVWNKVLASPIFTYEAPHPERGRYHAGNPGIPFQSSNGLYWFSETGGLLRLDLEKEEWCLMSRGEGSNIVEDVNNNLWMIADGKLYKYLLGK